MIFVIDDDEIMAGLIARAVSPRPTRIFSNAFTAISALSDGKLPTLIFLDILLDGPDGFTFLNELASYADTVQIPIVVVSSLALRLKDLTSYGVVGVLSKETMTPDDIKVYSERFA